METDGHEHASHVVCERGKMCPDALTQLSGEMQLCSKTQLHTLERFPLEDISPTVITNNMSL